MRIEREGELSAAYIEISRSAILANVRTIKRIIGDRVGIAAVVKACAYGHGADEIVEILRDEGIRFFAVHSIEEAARLDQSFPGLPILILGYVPLSRVGQAVSRSWRLTVSNIESVHAISEAAGRIGREAFVHLKLETGTNRQGILERQIPTFLDAIAGNPRIVLEGASMHFANIEDTTDHSFAQMQLDRYRRLLAIIESRVGRIPIRHTASSAASLLFESTHFDMIRFGISLYGLWPSKQTYLSYLMARKENSLLKPVLSWKTIVSEIKDVPAGEYIGYGCTYRTTYDSRIAVIPVGYFDGYDRKLSNLAHVLIRGKRAPVRGRICMDIFMVDVTHIPEAAIEDEVVLIGSQGEERITAEQLADWAGTINYEIVSRINPLLPRITVD